MEHNRRTDNILNNNNNWGTRPFAVAQKDCLSGSFVFPSQEGFPILVTGHTKDEDLILVSGKEQTEAVCKGTTATENLKALWTRSRLSLVLDFVSYH